MCLGQEPGEEAGVMKVTKPSRAGSTLLQSGQCCKRHLGKFKGSSGRIPIAQLQGTKRS